MSERVAAGRRYLEHDDHAAMKAVVRRRAEAAGYLGGGKEGRISGRVTAALLDAAKWKSGIESDTELLEYALSKVALEDDYGARLLARRGTVADDVEL